MSQYDVLLCEECKGDGYHDENYLYELEGYGKELAP